MDDDGVYEARYGVNHSSLFLLTVCVGFTAACVFLDVAPSGIRLVGALFFGAGIVVALRAMLSTKVALRVDADGVTLGQHLFRDRHGSLLVPWGEVRDVTVQGGGRGPGSVTVAHRAALLPQVAEPLRTNPGMVDPEAADELIRSSREFIGWSLHRKQFARALERFGPDVPVHGL